MDLNNFRELLLRLGFVDIKYIERVDLEEKTENIGRSSYPDNMIQSIWKNLGGDIRNHVTLNNVRIFLLAVLGTFAEPGLPRNEQTLSKAEDNEYGLFNEFGDLFLEPFEITKIQK